MRRAARSLPPRRHRGLVSVTMIAAVSLDGVLGVDGRIPWRCPADQRRFRERTMGGAVVMGRRTWESLPSKLDWGDRLPIVVSSRNAPRGRALLASDVRQRQSDTCHLLPPLQAAAQPHAL